MIPSTAFQHLKALSVQIGPRPSGSVGNKAAAAYIESVFRRCGLAVETQEFVCPAWEELGAWLCIDNAALPIAANTYSPSCLLSAQLAPVQSLAELESASLAGKLVLLYGELVRQPLPPKAWAFKDPAQARAVELLEAQHPAGVITVHSHGDEVERLIEDAEFRVPSATVSAKVGAMLLGHAGQTVRLRIDSRQGPGVTANVVGRLSGASRQQIVICAHYDTKIDAPGAADNASGVAVMLAMAEQLCRHEQPYSIEFVAFTNEEYLPLGDDEYVRRRAQSFDQIVAALNFDAVGLRAGVNTVAGFHLPPVVQQDLERLAATFPELIWVEPWPESNHTTFASRSVPCLAFTAKVREPHYHLRSDTIDLIDRTRLDEMVVFGLRSVETVSALERVMA